MSDTPSMLQRAVKGDQIAIDELFETLYGDLRERASGQRRRWRGNLTMNTTALVHEAYEKLAGPNPAGARDRAHFLALASRAMRQVLMDYARGASSQKRGGAESSTSLDGAGPLPSGFDAGTAGDLLDLENALATLERENESAARVVECRFFGGMTVEETGEALGISAPTVKRRWALARAWLYDRLDDPDLPLSESVL